MRTIDNLRWLGRQIRNHFATMDLVAAADAIAMGIGFEQMEYEHGWSDDRPIRPNDRGIALLALWLELVAAPISIVRQHYCRHPNFVDEGYGGPDSGCDAGHCPDCGWSYHVTMY